MEPIRWEKRYYHEKKSLNKQGKTGKTTGHKTEQQSSCLRFLRVGSRQRLQRFPKYPQNQDRGRTPRRACGEYPKKIPRTFSYKEVVLGRVFLMKQEAPRKSKG